MSFFVFAVKSMGCHISAPFPVSSSKTQQRCFYFISKSCVSVKSSISTGRENALRRLKSFLRRNVLSIMNSSALSVLWKGAGVTRCKLPPSLSSLEANIDHPGCFFSSFITACLWGNASDIALLVRNCHAGCCSLLHLDSTFCPFFCKKKQPSGKFEFKDGSC